MLPITHKSTNEKDSAMTERSKKRVSVASVRTYLSLKSEHIETHTRQENELSEYSSEKSYEFLFTKQEFLETIFFLNYNLTWMFIAASASIIIYVLFTYERVFGDNSLTNFFEGLFTVGASGVIVVDITVVFIHSLFSKMTKKRDIVPFNRGMITLDLISLFALFYLLIPVELLAVQIIILVLCIFRLYRVVRYFYIVSRTADLNNVVTLLKKYALVMVLMVHTFACVWKSVGCYLCSDDPRSDWTFTLLNKTISTTNLTSTTWYTICLYYTASLITTVGFGDIHGFTMTEKAVSVAMMITGYGFLTATFLGGWTAVQMEHYRRHAQFHNRFNLLRRYLAQRRVPKHLGSKMCRYYLIYWYKRGAVARCLLFDTFPLCLQQQVLVDTYWFFLQQSYYFRNASDAFKRALAGVMTTEIKIDGEIIFEQGVDKDTVVYIASGSIRLHSAEDHESTILTFGIGTLLGESCLTCGSVSPVRVTAASFSVLQILKRRDFWKIANRFGKLSRISEIHKAFNLKLADAKHNQHTKQRIAGQGETFKTLTLMKELLQTEKPRADDGYFHGSIVQDENEPRHYSDLYILSRQETAMKQYSDEIFARTVWPWSLHPQSALLSIWEYIVVGSVMFVAILYPYNLVFGQVPAHASVHGIIVNWVYIMDVFIQTLTSIESGNVIVSDVKEIFTLRIRSLQYVLDIIAAMPLIYIVRLLRMTDDAEKVSFLSACRLLKIQRIFTCMNKLGKNFQMNIPLVRMAKYVVILCFVVYFMGSVYYFLACYKSVCTANSWWQTLKNQDGEEGVRSDYPFAVSMYFAMLVVSQAGFGDISATNTLEMIALMIFFAIGVLVFSYLVADFSATLMLTYREKSNFIETVRIIRTFLVSNNMLPSIQNRINQYLLSQWMNDNGFSIIKRKYVMYDAPQCVLSLVKNAVYSSVILSVPLFHGLSPDVLREIGNKCKTVFLPPNEMIVYGGEIARDMFMIQRGFCLQINAASGKVEKVLGPHSHFSAVEMLLKQPGLFNIRSVTHVRLVKLSYVNLNKIFASHPVLLHQVEKIANAMMTEMTMGRLFMRSSSVTYTEIPEETQESWFIFPRRKLHPRNIDYENGFKNSGVFKFFKLVSLRRTVLPNGNFIMYWEIGRAVCAFLTGMAFPLSVHLSIEIPYYMSYIKILDILAIADIYIRLHVGYYNRKGILVTHPKFTAIHYLSHAFIVDFISVLPIQEMLHLFKAVNKNVSSSVTQFYRIQSYLAYVKLIQMYRLPDAFAYFQRDPFKRKSIFLNIMLFVPISLVFINFLASYIIILTTNIEWNVQESKFYFSSEPNSWHRAFYGPDREIDNVVELYTLAFYWVTTTCLTLGFGDIIALQPAEMYFVIFSIIAGYLFFTYALVVISSTIATINSLLTTYQKHMKEIISYMKKEKINLEIQTRVIRHFEHVWQKTNGLTGNFILEKCHMALRKDAVLSLYEQTLLEVPVFVGLEKSFFRLCGIQLHEYYLLKNELVIRLNDVVNLIYIIHKGEVTVKAPDGSVFAVLTRGCMFGNIDNISSSRSMVSIVAKTHIELLVVKTENFYKVVIEYPILKQRMQRHILLENLSYISTKPKNYEPESSNTDDKSDKFTKQEFRSYLVIVKKIFYGTPFELIAMLLSYASCIVVLFHMCFQKHSIEVLFLTYTLDVSHIIKIFLNFYKPFRNHLDEIIHDRVEIRKRYMAFSRFFVDLLAIIPFELFSLISTNNRLFFLSVLRLNRCFRYYEIYKFFDVKFNRLNINVSIFKLGAIAINFTLMLHAGACILYLVGCPAGKCNKNGWTFSADGHNNCEESCYFCSLYFMTCIITWAGVGDLHARTIPEMVVLVFLAVCTKFISATFVGDISAIVQSYSHALVNYDHGIVKLKAFLKNHDVSEPLRQMILNYSKDLWKKQSGYQIPVFLVEAPASLQHEIKMAAYGKHLYDNYVFEHCHRDFLRLLTGKLKIQTFFANNMICQQGDINNRMYFIHKGIVEVLTVEKNVEHLIDELHEMDCFGMVQGLFSKTPHNFTFKAATVCIILSLELKEWVLLLRYFPSARYEIYDKIAEVIT